MNILFELKTILCLYNKDSFQKEVCNCFPMIPGKPYSYFGSRHRPSSAVFWYDAVVNNHQTRCKGKLNLNENSLIYKYSKKFKRTFNIRKANANTSHISRHLLAAKRYDFCCCSKEYNRF